jgi:plastocyanin
MMKMNKIKTKSLFIVSLVLFAALVLSAAACSSSSTTTSPAASQPANNTMIPASTTAPVGNTIIAATTTTPAGNTITINLVAQNMAFDQSTLTVKAGAQVTVNFTNKDSVPHNLAVYTDKSAAQVIFKGDTIRSSSITYTFTAPVTPGTYFFRCDVHPTSMTGQFIVQ